MDQTYQDYELDETCSVIEPISREDGTTCSLRFRPGTATYVPNVCRVFCMPVIVAYPVEMLSRCQYDRQQASAACRPTVTTLFVLQTTDSKHGVLSESAPTLRIGTGAAAVGFGCEWNPRESGLPPTSHTRSFSHLAGPQAFPLGKLVGLRYRGWTMGGRTGSLRHTVSGLSSRRRLSETKHALASGWRTSGGWFTHPRSSMTLSLLGVSRLGWLMTTRYSISTPPAALFPPPANPHRCIR